VLNQDQFVNFEFDKKNVTPIPNPILEEVAKVLRANPNMKIEIHGYTDDQGPDQYNKGLAQNRADAVLNYLTTNAKIDPGRFTVVMGHGEDDPRAPITPGMSTGDITAARNQNRRVEFKIVNEKTRPRVGAF